MLLASDENVVWAKRHIIKKQVKASVVALMRGVIPERIWVPGNGWRKVRKYVELPPLCFNCCQYGHKAWRCQYDTVCRFCSGRHGSKECAEKIKEGVKIPPKCCNCGQAHNAGSFRCEKRPSLSTDKKDTVREPKRQLVPAEPPERNAWFPLLLESQDSTTVPETASFTASDDLLRHRGKSDGNTSKTKNSWVPRGSRQREMAAAVTVEAPTRSTVESGGRGGCATVTAETDAPRAQVVHGDTAHGLVNSLISHVTKLEEDNYRLQDRIRKLEERHARQQMSKKESVDVDSMVNPRDKINTLIGMLNDFLTERSGMLDNEIQGNTLMKVIMDIIKQWGRT